MSVTRATADIATGAAPGPYRLALDVVDVASARTLWTEVLGGTFGPGKVADTTIRVAPELEVALQASERPGPTELVVATARLDAVRDTAARIGLRTREVGDGLVLDDARFGGGHLRFVATESTVSEKDSDDDSGVVTEHGTDAPAVGVIGLRRADHVCFAVEDLHPGAAVLEAAGGWPVLGGDGPAGARALVFRFPHLKVEMLAPTSPDGPVARYLARRSGRSGIQHLTLFVHDVAAAVAGLTARGIPTVDTDATTRETWHETFLRPTATDGLLIQLARTSINHRRRLADDQLDGIHAGRYSAVDYRMHRKEG